MLGEGEARFSSRKFDIFAFERYIGRLKTLPILSLHLIMQHKLTQFINEPKFARYMSEVFKTYRQDVQYHNDLHGMDVAHMAHLFLTQGNLIQLAELNQIDILSFLLAAVCHDLGHDGYTNGYHVNAMSERAIRYSDVSVQENYHAAETFFIMQKPNCNFLSEKLTAEQFKVVRKRVIGCILATDMAKHATDLSALKGLVEAKQIKSGQNA